MKTYTTKTRIPKPVFVTDGKGHYAFECSDKEYRGLANTRKQAVKEYIEAVWFEKDILLALPKWYDTL
tara:strand:- start:112 stop:315 length:204 start_codon:yes stop_codon:yes gene_type:complete